MLSLAWVASAQAYGIDSLHIRVAPVPVAVTLSDSPKKRGLVAAASITETSSEQVMWVRAVVWRVIVSVIVIAPQNVVRAAASGPSSAPEGTGRNAPV